MCIAVYKAFYHKDDKMNYFSKAKWTKTNVFVILPLRKNLFGSKRNVNNDYFAFIVQVFYIGKQLILYF